MLVTACLNGNAKNNPPLPLLFSFVRPPCPLPVLFSRIHLCSCIFCLFSAVLTLRAAVLLAQRLTVANSYLWLTFLHFKSNKASFYHFQNPVILLLFISCSSCNVQHTCSTVCVSYTINHVTESFLNQFVLTYSDISVIRITFVSFVKIALT